MPPPAKIADASNAWSPGFVHRVANRVATFIAMKRTRSLSPVERAWNSSELNVALHLELDACIVPSSGASGCRADAANLVVIGKHP